MRKDNLSVWKTLVTFFGLGYTPIAPGTMGAIGGLIPGILILKFTDYPHLWLSILIILSLVIGIIGANKLQDSWGKDPSRIVIDETAGMWVSLVGLPGNLLYAVPAFIFFRIFDIYKPLGVRKMEDIKGGAGVMADDILAGVYANLMTQALYFIIKTIR